MSFFLKQTENLRLILAELKIRITDTDC